MEGALWVHAQRRAGHRHGQDLWRRRVILESVSRSSIQVGGRGQPRPTDCPRMKPSDMKARRHHSWRNTRNIWRIFTFHIFSRQQTERSRR